MKSTIIVTESADLEAASDFIAGSFQGDDLYQVRSVVVQTSVEGKLIELLKAKLKPLNTQSLSKDTLAQLNSQLSAFKTKGFEIIHGSDATASIVRCPRSMIASDNLPIVNIEVFRTTKEAISFALPCLSIGLWCENISIAFEYVNSLKNARQIWLNSSHGVTHPKIPFYNGKIVCDDVEVLDKCTADITGPISQVAGHFQFNTTFKGNTFQTVVIPFGETFAN